MAISVSPHLCFNLVLILIFMFLRAMYELGIFHAIECLRNHGRTKGEGWSIAIWFKPPSNLLLAVPTRLFCFGSLVVLDVVCRYLLLFVLYINIEIDMYGK